ncbi:MAG: recombinase family protein [Clostridium sp.]|nr:MAG: recombinase family protein [Clostridium sp.]
MNTLMMEYQGPHLIDQALMNFLSDFEQGLFDGIIVKDLSRLGRNLIEVGRFVEEFAINNNLRIISILDNYDSAINQDDDSIVLKSFVNDYYLKGMQEENKSRNQKESRS